MKKILMISFIIFCYTIGFCQIKIPIDSVSRHVGDSIQVCSKVYGIKALDKVTLINLGAAYPNSPLTAVIFSKDRVNFQKAPEVMYADKNICITGVVKEYNGRTEIIITSPDDIQIQ